MKLLSVLTVYFVVFSLLSVSTCLGQHPQIETTKCESNKENSSLTMRQSIAKVHTMFYKRPKNQFWYNLLWLVISVPSQCVLATSTPAGSVCVTWTSAWRPWGTTTWRGVATPLLLLPLSLPWSSPWRTVRTTARPLMTLNTTLRNTWHWCSNG